MSKPLPQRKTFTGTLTVRYKIEADDAHAARRLIASAADSTRRTGVLALRSADGSAEQTTVTSSVVK